MVLLVSGDKGGAEHWVFLKHDGVERDLAKMTAYYRACTALTNTQCVDALRSLGAIKRMKLASVPFASVPFASVPASQCPLCFAVLF